MPVRPQHTDDDAAQKHPVRIGRYRIERVLGQGGFGLVYLAHDEQLNREVAVKVPHARRITRPQDFYLYLSEAETVASLDHPGIVPVFDVGSTPEFAWYIMSKYVEGIDLAALLRKGLLGHLLSASLVASILVGLGVGGRSAALPEIACRCAFVRVSAADVRRGG